MRVYDKISDEESRQVLRSGDQSGIISNKADLIPLNTRRKQTDEEVLCISIQNTIIQVALHSSVLNILHIADRNYLKTKRLSYHVAGLSLKGGKLTASSGHGRDRELYVHLQWNECGKTSSRD